MGLLAVQTKKPGLLANLPQDYKGTLGELPSSFPSAFTMKTSTQAIPDETTGPNIPKVVAQGFAQGFSAFGAELAAVPGRLADVAQGRMPKVPFGETAFVPTGKAQQAILGTDKPISFRTMGQLPGVPETGPIAPIIGAFFGGLDLTGAGQGIRGLKGLTTALKDVKVVEDAARLMKTAGFTDDIIKDYAPMFAKITDTKKIEEGLLAAEKLQNTTKAVSPVDNFLTEKYGKTTEAATGSQLSEALMETKGSILGDNAKIGSVARGLDRQVFERKPDLLRGYQEGVVTDSYILINDKEIAQKIIGDYIKKKNELLGKRSGLSFDDVQKLIAQDIANAAKAEFPKWKTIVPDVTKLKPASIQGSYSDNGSLYTVLSNGTGQVVVDANKLAFMRKQLPDTKMLIGEPMKPVVFMKGKEVKGLLSPVNVSDNIPFKPGDVSTAPPTRPSQVPRAQDAAAVRPSGSTLPERTPPQSGIEPATIEPSQTLKAVEHIPEDIAKPFKQVVGIGEKTTKEPALYKRVTDTLGKGFTNFIEFVQDTDIRVRKLLETKGMKVTDATNPYQKATLYPGIVDTKIRNTKAYFETLVNDVVAIADQSGKDVAFIRKDINEYLHAVHAPERNAALGDGAAGMTNAQAAEVLKRINALPEAAEIRRIADDLRNLNREGLVLLREAGVISDEFFDTLVTKYKNHVPLNRIFDEDEIQGALSIRGFDVRSSGIKRAKGSEREVADIWSNIKHNYEQAVLRGEKNIVDQATLGYVRENREVLKGTMDVYKPRAIGKTFDGRIMMERSVDPQYLQLYENGKPIWIKIKDPALAVAMKGVGREKLPTLLHAVGAYTRFYAGLATRYALDFAFPNKLRDLQEMTIYMAAQKDIGFKGAAKALTKDPASMKAVTEAIMGLDTPGARVYNEMKALGGTTGGMGLSTRKRAEIDLDKMFAIAQSKPRQTAQDVLQYIDNWNTVFEDSTRLTVYKQALAEGLSKERAAFLAKEASINFNRMGRGGPVINAIWMFSNASIQGSAKMIRSLKNPKVAATVAVTVGTAVATMNQWNDTRDPDWRNKVTKWDRLNGIPIVLSGTDDKDFRYVVIPVSWGIKPIKVMADYSYDAASGRDTDVSRLASDFFTSVADAYNPLGGTDVISALTPTILDMPTEIARNKSWSGQKVRPDFDKNAPRDVQYFSNLNETALGEAFITTTKSLQENVGIALSPADMKYAFENLIGGAGKFGIKVGNVAAGAITDKPVPVDEYPFVSRFFRGRTEEEVGMGAGGDTQVLQNQLQSQSRERFYARQTAEDTYERMKELPKEEARAQFTELAKTSPDIAEKVSDIAKQEKKGLNYTERLITQLGVANGERALYVYEKLKVMQSNDDKSTLWQDYVTKGIITEQVADQISYLLKNRP